MAIINSYPLATPKLTDLVLGTSTSSTGQTSTKSFTIQSIKDTTAAVKAIVTATPDTLAITGTTNVTINTITAAVTNGGNSLATGNDIYDFVVGKITGTPDTVPIWTDATTLGDSLISQANNGVIISGNLASQIDGKITLNCYNGNHGVTIQAPSHSASATYTLILPTDSNPGAGKVLTSGAGTPNQLTWTDNGNVGGTGTQNKLSKWSDATTLADSNIEDTGTLITISGATKVTGDLELDADLLDINGNTGSDGQLLKSLGGGNLGVEWINAPATGVLTVTDGNTADNQGITIGGTAANPTVAANIATVTNTSKNLATGEQIQAAINLSVLTVATGNSDTITIGGTATNPTVAANTASGVGANLDNLATGGQIQAAIDAALAGAITFKGTFNASTGAITGGGNLTSGGSRVAVAVGDMYVVSVGGNFYGNSSTPLNVGDEVIAVSAAVAGASVEGDWNAVPSAGGGITGGGTTNKVPLWTGTTVLGDSAIAQSGTNIGIGTASPATTLQVGDGTADDDIRAVFSDGSYVDIHGYGLYMSRNGSYIRPVTDNTQTLYIGDSTHQWNVVQIDAATTQFLVDGTESMRITSSGKVGIGITNPSEKLEVVGNVSAAVSNGGGFMLTGASASGLVRNDATGLALRTNTTDRLIINSGGEVKAVRPRSNTVGDLALSIAPSNATASFGWRMDQVDNSLNFDLVNSFTSVNTNIMRYGFDGNVGIGTTGMPQVKLEIQQPQITTQYDTGSFFRLHPSATTNSSGFTNMFFGTSTSNNYGVAIGGVRAGTGDTSSNNNPEFAVRILNDSITGTPVLNINTQGQVKFNNYTSSGSFTGTAAANLAVDSSGNIITEAASGGGGGGTKTVSTVASVAAGVSTHALGVTVTTTPLVNYVDLYISGVYQSKTSYTVSGSTLTLTGATFPTGALIETVTTT